MGQCSLKPIAILSAENSITPWFEKPVRLEQLEKGYFEKCVSEASLTSFSLCHKTALQHQHIRNFKKTKILFAEYHGVCLALLFVPKGDKMVTRIEERGSG